jgi:hypothetical protein
VFAQAYPVPFEFQEETIRGGAAFETTINIVSRRGSFTAWFRYHELADLQTVLGRLGEGVIVSDERWDLELSSKDDLHEPDQPPFRWIVRPYGRSDPRVDDRILDGALLRQLLRRRLEPGPTR